MSLDKDTPCHIDVCLRQDVVLVGVASVLLAVDLLVVEEDTAGFSGTQEVVVGGAGARTTANRGTNLLAAITTLGGREGGRD